MPFGRLCPLLLLPDPLVQQLFIPVVAVVDKLLIFDS